MKLVACLGVGSTHRVGLPIIADCRHDFSTVHSDSEWAPTVGCQQLRSWLGVRPSLRRSGVDHLDRLGIGMARI